jgi:hypothetical protein
MESNKLNKKPGRRSFIIEKNSHLDYVATGKTYDLNYAMHLVRKGRLMPIDISIRTKIGALLAEPTDENINTIIMMMSQDRHIHSVRAKNTTDRNAYYRGISEAPRAMRMASRRFSNTVIWHMKRRQSSSVVKFFPPNTTSNILVYASKHKEDPRRIISLPSVYLNNLHKMDPLDIVTTEIVKNDVLISLNYADKASPISIRVRGQGKTIIIEGRGDYRTCAVTAYPSMYALKQSFDFAWGLKEKNIIVVNKHGVEYVHPTQKRSQIFFDEKRG